MRRNFTITMLLSGAAIIMTVLWGTLRYINDHQQAPVVVELHHQ